MFYNKSIDLYNVKAGSTDETTGTYTEGKIDYTKPTKSLIVDVQPYSKDKLLSNYGYEIDVSKRIFCDLDDSIKETSVIGYKGLFLEVKKIIEWDDYMEIMVLEAV